MRETKSLTEWLESKGSPKHYIAEGENGSMVIAIDDDEAIAPCVLLYKFKKTDKGFSVKDSIRLDKRYLPAIIGLLDKENVSPEPAPLKFNVVIWLDDEEGEGEAVIDIMEAVSEYHACALLRDRIACGKYPKGTYLDYIVNGKKIDLDVHGRVA